MAIQIVIPREGQSMESALIAKWHVKVGEKVKFGQVLCEVESEKALFDIEAPGEGTVLDIFYEEGMTAPVLTTIAVLGKPGEEYKKVKPASNMEEIEISGQGEIKGTLETINISELQNIEEKAGIDEDNLLKKVLISPRARKLAKERGIAIDLLTENPITEKHVLKYINDRKRVTSAAKEYIEANHLKTPSEGTGIGGRVRIEDVLMQEKNITSNAISGIRKVIADRMLNSIQKTAQFTLTHYADATKLLSLRKRLKSSSLSMGNITINDMLLYATANTLVEVKSLNAHFNDGILTNFENVNLGCAVDVEGGLMVPVIKDANKMSIKQISEKVKLLASECREGNIKPHEMKEGTFTVSNLGSFGTELFTPILNYPEVAILGVGGINPRPIRKNGEIEFVDHIALSLTVNHQIIDGAVGARFMELLAKNIENIDILTLM